MSSWILRRSTPCGSKARRRSNSTSLSTSPRSIPRYFEQPFYIIPTDKYATEGYLVIREALAKKKQIGIGQLTAGGREHLVGILPFEKGLMLHRLRYEDEIKPSADFFKDIPAMKLDHEMVELATELVGRKSGRFKPAVFDNYFETELRKLIEMKAKGKKIVAEPEAEPERGNVVNLTDALRNSLGTPRKEAPRKSGAASRKPIAKSKVAAKRGVKRSQGR